MSAPLAPGSRGLTRSTISDTARTVSGQPGTIGGYARSRPTDESVGSLIAEAADEVSKLFRQEVDLARAELKLEARKAGRAAGMLGGAGFASYMVALFASLALTFALDAIMPTGWAALIVTALWGITAAVLYIVGRRRMRRCLAGAPPDGGDAPGGRAVAAPPDRIARERSIRR